MGDERIEEAALREFIVRALKKQHGDVNFCQMLTARIRRLLGRMEGKTQEGQATHMRERIGRLRLRGHAPAEGLTARNQRQCRYQRVGRGNGGADGGVANGGRIGSPAALFHVRKLIA
jgi:hypothetical protein